MGFRARVRVKVEVSPAGPQVRTRVRGGARARSYFTIKGKVRCKPWATARDLFTFGFAQDQEYTQLCCVGTQ